TSLPGSSASPYPPDSAKNRNSEGEQDPAGKQAALPNRKSGRTLTMVILPEEAEALPKRR
ncbi:MAG: hypothetical protein KY468_21035, partial [Armatimonadetes bacterium]|nr:hypothetical protein [Armatimonadota bacterium]